MRKSKRSTSQLPISKSSNMDPTAVKIPRKSPVSNITRSVEDIPRRVQLSVSGSMDFSSSRTMSPALSQGSTAGVRYLTEELIKKVSKQDNLTLITTLNLTLSKDSGKKIKYIENLDSLKNLQTMNLSGNLIEKIEKLDKLSHLLEINLSFNFIQKIEGLDSLCRLQVLNLTGNQIEHIPQSLGKKLKTLRVFKIAKNNLGSLNELSRLKPLPDLAQLSIADNPLAELPHSRLYVIFHIRTLDILDGQPINAQDRQKAKERFSMEEIIKLEKTIEQQDGKYQKLEEEHNKSIGELKRLEVNFQNERKKTEETLEVNKNVEEELKIKNELLKKKTKELHRACEKHYQLEQELAFYKIDAKFASLGEEPQPDQTLDTDDNEPLLESPYIGKALFTPQQSKNSLKSSGQREEKQLSSDEKNIAKNILLLQEEQQHLQQQLQQQQHQKTEMDDLLIEKQKLIDSASDSLKQLHEELFDTESKVENAQQELQKMTDLVRPHSPNNEIKTAIRQKLADKMKSVNLSRNQAAVLEKEVNKAEISIKNNIADISEIKWQLQNIPPNEPIYKQMCQEIVEKEQQIKEDNEVSEHLQEQLSQMIAKIANETSEIKIMEQQLYNDDQNTDVGSDRLRQNLGSMVEDLQTYMKTVKLKNHSQMKHIEQLLSEREAMQKKIEVQEEMIQGANNANQTIHRLNLCLAETQDALEEQQRISDDLEKELQMKEEQEKDLQNQITETELDLKDLKQTIEETERRAQAEIQSIEQQLIAEKENTLMSAKKAILDIEKDRNVQHIMSELEKSKMLNSVLKDKLDENKKKFDRCYNDFILPADLKKKMKSLSHSLKTGKHVIEPEDNKDFVGQIFQDLQKGLQDKMNQMKKELDERKENERKAKERNQALNEKLKEMNRLLMEKKTHDLKQEDILNAKIASEKKVRDLQEVLQKLQKELADAETQLKLEKQKAFSKSVVYESPDNSEGSMNSEEKRLFEELQRELVDLKRRMLGKEEEFIQQLAATEAHAAHWESQAKQQQQQYSDELKGKQLENNLHKAQQQACIQVISQDLDNARRTADDLQKLLDERQKQLQSEMENANMSEQMIAGQEEELSHLYNILEQQRDEISNLNGGLDQLYGQNPDARGPSYDAEVNRLRDEVNSLRETLAMQSSYMENMPKFSTGTSTDPHLPQTQPTLPQVSNTQYISDDLGHFNGFQAFPSDNALDYQISPSPFNQTAAPQVPPELSPTLQQVSPPTNVYIQPQPVLVNSKDRRMDMAYIPSKQPSNFGSILVQPDHVGSESVQQFTNEAEQYDAPNHLVPEKSTTVHLTPHTNRNLDIAPQNPFLTDIISSGNSPTWQGVSTKFPSEVVTSSPKIIQPLQTQPILYVASPEKVDHRNHTQAGVITQRISSQPVKNSCLLTAGAEEHLTQPENSMHPVNSTGSHYQNYNPLKTVSFKQPFVQSTSESHDTAGSNLTGTLLPRRPIRFTSGSQYREPYRHSVNHQPQQLYTVTNHQPQQLYTEIEQQPQQLYSTTNQRQQLYNSTNYQTQQPQQLYNTTSHQPQQVHNTSSYQPQQPYTASNHQPQQLHAVSSYQPQQIFTTANNEPQKLYSVQAPIHPQVPPDVQTHIHPNGNIQYHTAIPGPPVASSSPVNLHTKDYGRQHGKQFSPIKTVLESNVQPTFPSSRTLYHPEHEGMFCNIPEHSNLEHLVNKLQRKLARWKSRFQYQMQREEADTLQKKSKLMYKLKEQLEERRNELEGLDLAIERQKRNQEKMMKEERQLMCDHKLAKEELLRLQRASLQNRKRKHIPHNYIETDSSSDSSFEDRESYKKQLKLQDEIKCLEKTLFKRQAQLKDADAKLKEYKQNLNDAKLQAEETVRKHDSASSSLHTVRKETRELEERANKAGLQLITESGNLKMIKTEYKEMQQKKSTLEKILADINVIITEKDREFRKLDSKIQTSNQRLQLVQRELTVTSEAEREATKSLINSKGKLEKTKLEISKLREQGEILALQVKDLNKHVCQKQKELSNIQEDLGKKKSDIDNLLREAQTAVVLKQRELKACHEKLVKLEGCHLELATVTRNKKGELEEVTKELEKQRQAASVLNSNINEEKQTLQTAIDQRKIVQANTDALKNQMEQKYAELEKTFKHLSEEKLNLSNVVKETDHHKKELKLLQQSVIEERSCLDKLMVERGNLQEKVSSLSREHNQLVKNHSEFDTKLNEAKTELYSVETTIKEKTGHLNSLQDDIQHEEDLISQCQNKKTMLETELESLQENISERQKELNTIEKSLQDAEIQMSNSKEKSEQINSANIDSQVILDHLTSEIKQQRILRCNQQNQVKVLQKQLEQLTYSFEEKTTEMEKISMSNSEAREKLDSMMNEIKEAEHQLQELRNKIGIFQKHSTEIKDVEQLKNELKIDVKLLNEQKSSLELHLNELKKDITRQLFLEHQPEKENLENIIRYNDEEWRREALKEKLIEEQDHVRMQLQQKMHHHFDVLDSTKQQSEGVLNKLKHKLNILQDVFISNKGP